MLKVHFGNVVNSDHLFSEVTKATFKIDSVMKLKGFS